MFIDLVLIDYIKQKTNFGSTKKYIKAISLVKKVTLPKFPLAGKDVLDAGIKSGPLVGDILKKVEKWWIENEFKPKKKECINKIKSL